MAGDTVGCEALDTAALWSELRAIAGEYAAGAVNRGDGDPNVSVERGYVQGSFGGKAATPERSDVDLVVGVPPDAAMDAFEERLESSSVRLGAASDGPMAGFDIDVVPAAAALGEATRWATHDGAGTESYETVFDLREQAYRSVV